MSSMPDRWADGLLERWSAVEPNRCKLGAHSKCWRLGRDWCDLLDVHHQALLLAAVMEAIEAHGWFWRLAGPMSERDFSAEVVTGPDFGDQHMADGPSSAVALLTTYLDAIEAVSPVDG